MSVVRQLSLLAILTSVALGCASKPAPSTENPAQKTSQAVARPAGSDLTEQYESVRAGFVMIDSAIEGLEELRTMLKELDPKLTGEAKSLGANIFEALDTAGALLAEIHTDLPDAETYEKEFAAWDEERLGAITRSNDALHELNDVGEGLAAIAEIKSALSAEIDDIILALRLAEEDLSAGIVKLGGAVEKPED